MLSITSLARFKGLTVVRFTRSLETRLRCSSETKHNNLGFVINLNTILIKSILSVYVYFIIRISIKKKPKISLHPVTWIIECNILLLLFSVFFFTVRNPN